MNPHLPVPRIAHIDVAIMVEAALMGYNPVAMATLLGQYILDLDRETAMEAERQRRLPVVQAVEWAMHMEFSHAIYGEPFDFDLAVEIAAEGVWDMADGVARASAGLADDVGSFIPVLARDAVSVELFVMFALLGRVYWTWDRVCRVVDGVVLQIRIQQPFYADTKPAWRRP